MRNLFFFGFLFFAFSANAQNAANNVISIKIMNETSLLIQSKEFELQVIPMAIDNSNAGGVDYFEFSYFPINNKEKWHHSYTVFNEKRMELMKTQTLKFQKITGGNSNTSELYFIGNYIIEVEKQPYNLVIRKIDVSQSTIELPNKYFNSEVILRDNAPLNWVNEDHKISKNFDLQEDFFMGLGEKTGPVNRKGNAYTMWNSDVPAYGLEQDPLYVSIPFYIAGNGQNSYGIYVDHSCKSYFNFGAACNYTSISVEDDHLRYYVILGKNSAEIAKKYRNLTGHTPLPPRWSLGFHQSRWSYKSQDEVMSLAAEFKKKNMPVDAIHLDIHYMDACKVFTFNQQQFKNPKLMVDELKNNGINIITILDPGIKIEQGYSAYDNALKNDLFLKYPSGQNYEAGVWPGLCAFPDFTNPKARKWWSESVKFYTDLGISGLWNDMNEPAAWGKEVPTYIRFNREGHISNLTQNRNVYGMQMARATREGAEALLQKRVFTLTRAGFAGIQRYAAVWTGDNVASDEHMMLSFKLLTNMSLCGVDFVGADVGGFMNPATPELFTRWMSAAAFTPFYRAHKMIDMPQSEPWCYGDIHTEINRYYMQLRYRLMPYLYASMQNNEFPVLKSMAYFQELTAENYWNGFNDKFESQFMLGNSLLITPAKSTQKSTEVYLPKVPKSNKWYSLHSDIQYTAGQRYFVAAPLSQLPIFVKAGSVIPEIVPQKIENTLSKTDTLNFHVYYSELGDYEGYFYDDDGISLKNPTTPSLSIQISGKPMSQEIEFNINKIGNFNFPYTVLKFFIHGLPQIKENQMDDIPKPRIMRINNQQFVAPSANVKESYRPHFALQQDLYKVDKIDKTATPNYIFHVNWLESSFKLTLE